MYIILHIKFIQKELEKALIREFILFNIVQEYIFIQGQVISGIMDAREKIE